MNTGRFLLLSLLLGWFCLGDAGNILQAQGESDLISAHWMRKHNGFYAVWLPNSLANRFPKTVPFPHDHELYGLKLHTKVIGNTLEISVPLDERVCMYTEIYPLKPKIGDCWYSVCYIKNISDSPIQNVYTPDFSQMMMNNHKRNLRGVRGGIFRRRFSELPAGGKALLYSRMQSVIYPKGTKEALNLLPFMGICEQENYVIGRTFNSWILCPQKEKYTGPRPYVDISACVEFDAYTPRPEAETVNLVQWLEFIGPDKGQFQVIPSDENPEPVGDDVYDFYLSDPFIGADETLLEEPSTARDEMKLTRLILEYAKGE
ncbi:MAG: hypothetical protein Q4C70_01725, partial [Planctomycetia bacterium]|nr:hypothetical protein [Planctomycetia bacterium]